jgi:hypothetical protein
LDAEPVSAEDSAEASALEEAVDGEEQDLVVSVDILILQ